MRTARWIFLLAGLYGVAVIAPQYFLERLVGEEYPPAITHPEYFYGFVGVGVAWQVAFLVVASDPVRLRPIMLPAVLEKATFGLAAVALFAWDRVPLPLLVFGLIDLAWGVLFLVAWRRVGLQSAAGGT